MLPRTAGDFVNVAAQPATDLVNVAWGPPDLVNVGPPPAADLVTATSGGGRLSQCWPPSGDRLSQCNLGERET